MGAVLSYLIREENMPNKKMLTALFLVIISYFFIAKGKE
jgi:hypothetical protein